MVHVIRYGFLTQQCFFENGSCNVTLIFPFSSHSVSPTGDENVSYPGCTTNNDTSRPQGKFVNDVGQEMQQSGLSKDGDDSDVLAEDKMSPMLEGEEEMSDFQKLTEGGDLEGRERIVRERYGMEVEEDGHCLKEGESGCEDEDGDLKQIEEKDDSTEGEISTKSRITRYSNALDS